MNNNKAYLTWQFQRWAKRLNFLIYGRLYQNPPPAEQNSIMVAGTARSGTTWLANIIASQLACRLMFEPFHARKVKAFGQFNYFQYMRPDEENAGLRAYCQMIFSGTIRNHWIDRRVDRLTADYRLIKDIRTNLFLKWLHNRFREVPLLFIMRHPCAVVASRLKLNWDTDGDIAPLLAQQKLVDDFLGDKQEVIAGATTAEEKHAIIWCISNLVPLRQFQTGELPIIYYEHLCHQPELEIDRVFQYLRQAYQTSIYTALNEPSSTTIRSSAVVTGDNRLSSWQKSLSREQIDRILATVDAFGLSYVYGDSLLPLATAPGYSADAI